MKISSKIILLLLLIIGVQSYVILSMSARLEAEKQYHLEVERKLYQIALTEYKIRSIVDIWN